MEKNGKISFFISIGVFLILECLLLSGVLFAFVGNEFESAKDEVKQSGTPFGMFMIYNVAFLMISVLIGFICFMLLDDPFVILIPLGFVAAIGLIILIKYGIFKIFFT